MSDPKLLVLMSCEESMCCTEPDFNCDQKQFVEHIFRKGNQVIGEESVTNRKCDGGTLHALPCWNTPGYNMPDMFVCIEREKSACVVLTTCVVNSQLTALIGKAADGGGSFHRCWVKWRDKAMSGLL